MAYRGSRSIVSARGGDTLKIHFVDEAGDLAAIQNARAGDIANLVGAGPGDGKLYQRVKSSSGLAWAPAGIGTGDVTIEGDLISEGDVTANGDLRSFGSVVIKDGPNPCTITGTFTAERTLTAPDRTGTIVTHTAGVIGGLPIESEIDFASPSADGLLTIKNSISTNKGRLRTTGGIGVFNADPMPAALAAVLDLPAFTDPPTAGEMATLRATINSILASQRAGTGIGTIAAA